jgi:hypothetical protein
MSILPSPEWLLVHFYWNLESSSPFGEWIGSPWKITWTKVPRLGKGKRGSSCKYNGSMWKYNPTQLRALIRSGDSET